MFRAAQGQPAQLALLAQPDRQVQLELVPREQQALGLRVQLELQVQQDRLARQDRVQPEHLACRELQAQQAAWAQPEQPDRLDQARPAPLDRKARQVRLDLPD